MATSQTTTRGDGRGLLKIFHLFANHKFTGPADPALVLAAGQAEAGAEIRFISSTHPDSENTLEQIASKRGLHTIRGLRIPKHFRLSSLRADVRKLRKLIEQERPDFIHSHLAGDHLVAALARTPDGPLRIRSTYDLDPPRGLRATWISRHTDFWIAPTEEAARRLASHCKGTPDKIRVIPPLLDLARFKPALHSQPEETNFTTTKEKIVVGVVARMQRHRRFPQLIDAFVSAARLDSRLQLEILGRGTHQDEVARIPARNSGLEDRIHFAGYIDPEFYPTHLSSFDMLLLLVPGSDGTCRAAREALACGVPVIASRIGLLPDLIPPEGGLLLENEETETLTRAILTLAGDPLLRQKLSLGARNHARAVFDKKLHIKHLLDDLELTLTTS